MNKFASQSLRRGGALHAKLLGAATIAVVLLEMVTAGFQALPAGVMKIEDMPSDCGTNSKGCWSWAWH